MTEMEGGMDEQTKYQFQETMGLLDAISSDLTTMLRIGHVPYGAGNCNIPLALYALTSMSFLGYLIAEEELDLGDPVQLVMTYFEQTFSSYDVDTLGDYFRERLPQLGYGLIHTWVPAHIGIDRRQGDQSLFIDSHTLNAQQLAIMVVQSIKRLKGMMVDPVLAARMWHRWMAMREMNDITTVS